MNRTMWIVAGVVVLILILVIAIPNATRPPAVQINTDAAKVSIGPEGVSISVAPSQQ